MFVLISFLLCFSCSSSLRDLEVRILGVADLDVHIRVEDRLGIRNGDIWTFHKMPTGRLSLSFTVPDCPEVSEFIQMENGEGAHYHESNVDCVTTFAGQAFRFVPAGEFQMGSPPDETSRNHDESIHSVLMTRPFWIAQTELTQGVYAAVTGVNPAERTSGECSRTGNLASPAKDQPVYCVSWFEALEFANLLSEKEGLNPCYQVLTSTAVWKKDCEGYRLPTEAEWERAARAVDDHLYSGSSKINDVGWTLQNSKGQSHPVAQKKPNSWGIYDMSGNIWEWVWDIYEPIRNKQERNPRGASSGTYRGMRGGTWQKPDAKARISARANFLPVYRMDVTGFRLVRETN